MIQGSTKGRDGKMITDMLERLHNYVLTEHGEIQAHVIAGATGFSLEFCTAFLDELVRQRELKAQDIIRHDHFLCGMRVAIRDRGSVFKFPLTCPSCEREITGDGDIYMMTRYLKVTHV